jgi:hypothetical protein
VFGFNREGHKHVVVNGNQGSGHQGSSMEDISGRCSRQYSTFNEFENIFCIGLVSNLGLKHVL